jgi:hypothetical protein
MEVLEKEMKAANVEYQEAVQSAGTFPEITLHRFPGPTFANPPKHLDTTWATTHDRRAS